MNPLQGVNPANGIVLYYNLPEQAEKGEVKLEVLDSDGNLVRAFSSEKEDAFEKYEGGPPEPSVLPKKAGLNRFVWDMRYRTMPGIPKAYIEASYRGHKAIPGKYTLRLGFSSGEESSQKAETVATISANPLYSTTQEEYQEFHQFRTEMEQSLTSMHGTVNRLYRIQQQLGDLLELLSDEEENESLVEEGRMLVEQMKQWDEEMVHANPKLMTTWRTFPTSSLLSTSS